LKAVPVYFNFGKGCLEGGLFNSAKSLKIFPLTLKLNNEFKPRRESSPELLRRWSDMEGFLEAY